MNFILISYLIYNEANAFSIVLALGVPCVSPLQKRAKPLKTCRFSICFKEGELRDGWKSGIVALSMCEKRDDLGC
ncbi:hypothetical protein [Noviherbaspirillum sp.]|jgi:hypothetical protein|nr:hypothetical protein [Noviherbaspirillum sp.]